MSRDAEDSSKTLNSESTVGRQLSKVCESMHVVFQGGRIPIVRRIFIGRDPTNSIVLEDPLVSRRHAVIRRVKNDYLIKDLRSTNGTHLWGKPIPPGKYVPLKEGDTFLIGHTELSLQHSK